MSGSVLEWPTLVLNKAWKSVDASTVQDTMSTVAAKRAKIMHPESYTTHDYESWLQFEPADNEPSLRTPRHRLKIPVIIVCNEFDRFPNRVVVFSRRNLWKRDHFTCQYCGVRPPADEITVDHVVPKSRGGLSSFPNCVLACVACNKKKDDHTPEEAGMKLFRWKKGSGGILVKEFYHRPKTPSWSPIYSVGIRHLPEEHLKSLVNAWATFVPELREKVEGMYWNVELEP